MSHSTIIAMGFALTSIILNFYLYFRNRKLPPLSERAYRYLRLISALALVLAFIFLTFKNLLS